MTPTQPSQAVEAVLHRDQDGTFFLKYEGDEQIYDVAMRNSPLGKAIDAYATAALRAELARPHEVAAPVGGAAIIAKAQKDWDDAQPEHNRWENLTERSRLLLVAKAASRVPVALPAEPAGHFIENFGETGRWQQCKTEIPGITRPLYATPAPKQGDAKDAPACSLGCKNTAECKAIRDGCGSECVARPFQMRAALLASKATAGEGK